MALYGDGSNVNKTTSATASTTFGSDTLIPLITVDANQRISSIANSNITMNASVNSNASVGDVGTYAFLQQSSANAGAVNPGATAAGSTLRYSDATGRFGNSGPNGSWRCMGYDSGAALVSAGSGNASASASGNVSGSLQGGQVQGNASLQGGQVQGNTNANGNLGVTGGGQTTKGSLTASTSGLNVGGTAGTSGLNVSGTAGTSGLDVSGNVGTDGLDVSGNVTGTASINVSVNSVSVNTTVAYSSTLWLRYS